MVTLKAVQWEPHLAVRVRVEIFESCEKILPDLDSGACGIANGYGGIGLYNGRDLKGEQNHPVNGFAAPGFDPCTFCAVRMTSKNVRKGQNQIPPSAHNRKGFERRMILFTSERKQREIYKQFGDISKAKREHFGDEVIPFGL